jgi:hypothetical protein
MSYRAKIPGCVDAYSTRWVAGYVIGSVQYSSLMNPIIRLTRVKGIMTNDFMYERLQVPQCVVS